MAQKATSYLGGKLNTVVSVEKIDISFFKFIRLENFYIEDLNQDTLIYVNSLSAEINDWNYKKSALSIDFGKVEVASVYYNLNQASNDSLTSLTRVFESLKSTSTDTSSLDIQITSEHIVITDGVFNWHNHSIKNEGYGVNWDHLGVTDINSSIYDFSMVNDSFRADISSLSGKDTSGFVLNNLSGITIFSHSLTQIENLKLNTPYSDISGDLEYTYDSVGSYADFINQVYMRYSIDSSIINLKDIAYFSPSLEGLDYEVLVYGKERGPVSDMKFQDIYLAYGDATVLNGRIFISGLPNLEATSFNCRFKQFSSSQKDLSTLKTFPFTQKETIPVPDFLANAGPINFTGRFNGFYNNFVTNGTFTSDNGTVTTDLKLSQESSGEIFYDGKIKTLDFNLAELTNKPELFGKTSFDIDVKGENLSFEELDLALFGTASSFDFMGYRYTDVKIDAAVHEKVISGMLGIADTNLNLAFDGKIDLSHKIPKYEFTSDIGHLRPKQLKLLDRDSTASLSTKVIFNFQGSSLDNILGRAALENFHFIENERVVDLKQVDFTAYTIGQDKLLSIKSDNIDLQINGQFYLEDLVESFNHVIYKWLPSAFATPPVKPNSVEKFNLVLKASRFSGFSSIFVPQITFENDLFINLTYNSETEEIDVISNSSKMNIVGQDVEDLKLDAKLTLDTFELNVSSRAVLFSDSNFLENVTVHANAHEDLIATKIAWNNHNSAGDDAGDLFFDIQFTDPENFRINAFNSWMTINDTTWTISDSSKIIKNQKEYEFIGIKISQNDQDLLVNGFISEDPEKKLSIDIDSLSLSVLNPILNKYNMDINGTILGTTELFDFYDEFRLHSNTLFKDLEFNHQKIGDGKLISLWNSEKQKFDIDVNFFEKQLDKLSLKGSYYPKRKENRMDIILQLDSFPAKIMEPFTAGIIDRIQGTISGKTDIKGNLDSPLLNGAFRMNDIQTRVIYLNETLFVDDQEVFIRPNLIGADAVIIKDSEKKEAQVNFSLFHKNFASINYDVSVTSLNLFRAFNTSKDDNKYFYGQIYLDPGSTIGVESDYNGNISLNAEINSGPGTFVSIPFYEDDEVSERDYIYFKDPVKSSDSISSEDMVEEETFGLDLDMTMKLNKNAEIQLMFDEYTNDKIQAIGKGNISLKITEHEDFNIYGTYEIIEGFYLFTFSKIISKKFDIKPGSKLSWNGDPYQGKANINASYKVRTSLYELGLSTAIDTNESKKRIPVEVVLNMTGNYMNPDLAFSFVLPPRNEEVQTLLNSLDPGEKNKQVFALLILNKFMPITGSDISSGNSALASNSTEVLSNQLSNWLSKISDDFDVGVRYSPGDEKTTADEVELALSTQLFDDRVLLETNFGISGNTNTSSQTSSSTFIGEFTVSYKINEKGNIVGKIFQRSNELNPVTYNTSQYTQGIGIAYSEPFKNGQNLGCIMSNHLKKADNKRNCEEEYYQQQIEQQEESSQKIKLKVAKSRKKQKEKNRKKDLRDKKAIRKNNDS